MEELKELIHLVRGRWVMLDRDVARVYGYETKALNQAVKRNKARFPEHYCFQVSGEEYREIMGREVIEVREGSEKRFVKIGEEEVSWSQSVTLEMSNRGEEGSQNVTLKRGQNMKYLPWVFTEQGIAMLAGLLKSEEAVRMSIRLIDTFVEMRKFLAENGETISRISKVEYRLLEQGEKLDEVLEAVRKGRK